MARDPVPGPIVLGNAGELILQWDFGGRRRTNVLHFTGTSTRPVTQANVDTTNLAARAAFTNSGLASMTAPSFAFLGVTARDMSTTTSPVVEGSDQTPIIGAGTSDALPSQIAVVASLKCDKRGRNYHGRAYIPGASETDSDANGLPSPAYTLAVVEFLDEIRAHLAGVNWPMAVVSHAFPADPTTGAPAKPADFANVTSIKANTSFGTQRRRRI